MEEVPKQKEEQLNKGQVIENEASKFLKFIKHSEYSVVKQLNKLSTRIYCWHCY